MVDASTHATSNHEATHNKRARRLGHLEVCPAWGLSALHGGTSGWKQAPRASREQGMDAHQRDIQCTLPEQPA
eukprot:5017993-Alexandrium_andersonii.AAC.1